MDMAFIASALPKLWVGIDETLLLAFSALAIGLVLACILALMRNSRFFVVRSFASAFVYLFRSTPLLVQIFLIYYGSGQFRAELQSIGLWWLFKEAWWCAILALSLNSAAYGSEIIRGGLQSVPFGQIEAARAVGMSPLVVLRRITAPIVFRQSLPAYGNEIILLVKATSLASTITIMELTGIAKKIIAATFQPVEVFIVAGAVYLSINMLVVAGLRMLERAFPHRVMP